MFNTPILFLIFNRPDTTIRVFEQIRKIKPTFLYVAADGPRSTKYGESETCQQVRNLVLDGIDWDCKLITLFRDENLGCGKAVSEAITWFFNSQLELIHLAQALNYLELTNFDIGLLVNFGSPKLEFKRLIHQLKQS